MESANGTPHPVAPLGTQYIGAEQVKLLYTQAPVGFVATLLNAAILLLVFWGVVASSLLVTWFTLILVVTGMRCVLVQRYRKAAPAADQVTRWRTPFILGAGAAGVAWGASALLLFPPASLAHQVFLAFVLGGMAVGAVGLLSAVMAAFLAFFLPAVLPLIARFLSQGGTMPIAMSVLGLSFAGALLAIARHFHTSVTESLALRFENLELIRDLSVAKEQAESASRAKSQFLANMSHELRTPLNGVIGAVALLRNTGLTDQQRRLAQLAHRSGRMLLGIINDLLDFSKIEAGKLELERLVFDPRQTIGEVIEVFAESARRKGLTVTCTIQEEVPPLLRGDPGRLNQVLTNLLDNAVKFTEQGEIAVEVHCLGPDPRPLDSCVLRLVVRDTGIGIFPEARARIFDPFAQADGSTSRRYGGTGLGLAIVKQLVSLMGGEIWVESALAQGATFWFTVRLEGVPVPTDARQVVAGDPHGEQECGQAQERFDAYVLLVEDNPVNQEVSRLLLESMGCRVDLAADGQAALARLSRGHYDLIIFMDCQLPGMDGFETTRLVREKEADRASALVLEARSAERTPQPDRTPIIALTAHAVKGDRDACLAAGMDDYVSKPFSQGQLSSVLRRWLPHRLKNSTGKGTQGDPQGQPAGLHVAATDTGTLRHPPGAPAVDRTVLQRLPILHRKDAPDILARLIQTYLTHSSQLLRGIREASERGDPTALRGAAHALKSGSASLGASSLAALCHDLEAAGQANDFGTARDVLAQLEEEYERVRTALSAELGENGR